MPPTSRRVRIRIRRQLFKKLAAAAAAERKEVDALVVDAVRAELRKSGKSRRRSAIG